MKITINSAIFNLYPNFTVHACWVQGMNMELIHETNFETLTIDESRLMQVLADWKAAYTLFSAPKTSKVSLDYLGKAVMKQKLKKITPIVDLYNAISIKHYVPMGGEDLLTLQKKGGDLTLRLAHGDEVFYRLNATTPESMIPNEVIWSIGDDVVCRSMNAIESDLFKITDTSHSLLFISEALTATDQASAANAMNDLMMQLKPISQTVGLLSLNARHPEVECPCFLI